MQLRRIEACRLPHTELKHLSVFSLINTTRLMRQVDQPTRHRLCPSSSAFSYPAVSLYVCLFVCVCVCVPNTVVLEKCGTTGIEALLLYRPSFVGRSRCPNGRLQDSEASLLRSTRNGKRLAGGPLQ